VIIQKLILYNVISVRLNVDQNYKVIDVKYVILINVKIVLKLVILNTV